MSYKSGAIDKEEKIKCNRDRCVKFDDYILSGSRTNPVFTSQTRRHSSVLALAFYDGEADRLVRLLNESFPDSLIDNRIIYMLFKEAGIKPFYN